MRHVKCDENKPSCERCTSTGRICDGYLSNFNHKTSVQPSIERISTSNDFSPAELRSFDFFRSEAAPMLSSCFDAGFWQYLVLQMSSLYPAIRHAVIAIGDLLENKGASDRSSYHPSEQRPLQLGNWRNHGFAIKQYNKAIAALSHGADCNTPIDAIILACILFICIESLRGEVATAIRHCNSGMSIALSHLQNIEPGLRAENVQRLRNDMLPVLCRANLLSILFGNSPSWDYAIALADVVPDEFTSFRQARDSMFHLMSLSIRFRRVGAQPRRLLRSLDMSDYQLQFDIQQQIRNWNVRYEELFSREARTPQQLQASRMLQIHRLVTSIMTVRSTDIDECAVDSLYADFEAVVSLAEDILECDVDICGTQSTKTTTFLLDMEMIPPLYFVAQKCRHPALRRRAISILQRLHRLEGFWDSDLAAAVAKRIMEVEERNLSILDGSELPAEGDRIHQTHNEVVVGANGMMYVSSFRMMAPGSNGEWMVWKEEFAGSAANNLA